MVGDKVTMLSFKRCNWRVSFRVKLSCGLSSMVGIKVYRVKRWGVEVLGGGAPTLLHASEFLFVETRLV